MPEHSSDQAPAAPVVALVLAAGGGTRFRGAGHKLTARLPDGRTVAHHAVAAAIRAAIGPVVVVTGAVSDLPDLPTTVTRELDDPPGTAAGHDTPDRTIDVCAERVLVVHNPDWQLGQSTSLRVGLEAAADLGAAAVVVGLADQPGIEPEAWRRVAASDSPIAVATYDGRRGNPVRLGSQVWPLLVDRGHARADEGARGLIRSRPDLVEPVPCPGSPDDIDTVEDLQRWQRRSSTNSP